MIDHRSVGFLGKVSTAGLPKYYRHCVVWVLSVHKLHFDCDVAGRSLAIGEV